jgi:hypothetical protein
LASGGTYNFSKILKSAMVFMAKLLSHSRHRRACACECEYSVVGVACGKWVFRAPVCRCVHYDECFCH